MRKLEKLTIISHAATRDHWRTDLSEEVYTSTLKNTLDAIGSKLLYEENSSSSSPHSDSYYGLFKDDNAYASAILTVTETKHVNLTKVLSIYILHDAEALITEESIEELAKTHADLLTEYFKIAGRTQGKVKVYARTDLELKVFQGVHAHLSATDDFSDITNIEGRWLVIEL